VNRPIVAIPQQGSGGKKTTQRAGNDARTKTEKILFSWGLVNSTFEGWEGTKLVPGEKRKIHPEEKAPEPHKPRNL